MIAMRSPVFGERFASVDGLMDACIQDPNHVGVLGIGKDFHVVPGARLQCPSRIDEGPRLASVVGTIDSAVWIGFDNRIQAISGCRYVDTYFPQRFGQSGHDRFPSVAAVAGLPDATAGAAAVDFPGVADMVPEGGVQNTRVRRIHCQFTTTRVFIEAAKNEFPGLAAIFGAINAAVFGRPKGSALGGDVDQIFVGRMNADAGDGAGL